MFPERQLGPHKHWDEEVKFLDGVFGAPSLDWRAGKADV